MSLKNIPIIHEGEKMFLIAKKRNKYTFAKICKNIGGNSKRDGVQTIKVHKKNLYQKGENVFISPLAKGVKYSLLISHKGEFERMKKIFPRHYREEMGCLA